MSLDDGLVHADPSRLAAQPQSPRSTARFGRDKGADIPTRTDYVARAEAAARPRSATSPTSPIILFTLDETDAMRASWRRSPAHYPALRLGPGLVVPRQPRGHAPLPRADHRDRRLLQHRRLQRRHPRLLLDPGAPRRGPARRLRLPRHASSPPGGWRRTRRTRSRTTSPIGSPRRPTGSEPQGEKTMKLTAHLRRAPRRHRPSLAERPAPARRRCARPTPTPTAIRPSRRSSISAGSSRRRPAAASASRSSTPPSSARRRTRSSRPASA